MKFVSYMVPGFSEELFTAIAEALGADLTMITSASGPMPGSDPFATGEFDFGWICSTSFVALNEGSAGSVSLAGVAWAPDDALAAGQPVYFADVVVRADSEAQSLEDLAGCRFGCNDEVSLSGHHAVRFELAQRGHDPDDFLDVSFTGGHHDSLDALIDGRIDAAAVDSVVRIGRSRQDPVVAGLRVIERLGPWPTQPLVARADLDPGLVKEAVDSLIGASKSGLLADELAAAAVDRLVRVGPNHYDPVRSALALTAN